MVVSTKAWFSFVDIIRYSSYDYGFKRLYDNFQIQVQTRNLALFILAGNFKAQTFLAAHTTAYTTLEQELLPQFVQSTHYFQYVLGKPASELPMKVAGSTGAHAKGLARQSSKQLTAEELALMDLPKPPSESE